MQAQDFLRILHLSETEYYVFCAMGEGLTTKEIAVLPGHICSAKTVEAHQQNIRTKLKVLDIWKVRAFATRYLVYKETYNVERRRISIRDPHFTFVNKHSAHCQTTGI